MSKPSESICTNTTDIVVSVIGKAIRLRRFLQYRVAITRIFILSDLRSMEKSDPRTGTLAPGYRVSDE